MVVRRAVFAALLALAATTPARAAEVVEIEFTGTLTVPGQAVLRATATGAGTGGVFRDTLSASADESTTPDLCTSFAQASFGTFSVAGMSGRIDWFRSHNALVLQVSEVNGRGFVDGSGAGTAVLVADPVAVTFASCTGEPTRLRIVGSLTIQG